MKTKNMNFIEAVKAMKEGKKVIRKDNKFCIFQIENDDFDRDITLKDIEATDWEIVEEKKTLSDKIYTNKEKIEGGIFKSKLCIDVEDVKPFLKELVDWSKGYFGHDKVEEKVKEIFGKRLI